MGMCYKCKFLSKILSGKSSIIYKCSAWRLKTVSIVPEKVVLQSIGEEKCPLFKENDKRFIDTNSAEQNKLTKVDSDSDVDILI